MSAVREITAYPLDRMAVVGEQLRVRGQAVAARSRTTTPTSLPVGSRRLHGRAAHATTFATTTSSTATTTVDDGRDDVRGRSRIASSPPAPWLPRATRGHRCAAVGDVGLVGGPRRRTRRASKVPARWSKVSEPRARAHLGGCQRRPVVDRTTIAEAQQSGAEPQSHRPFEIALRVRPRRPRVRGRAGSSARRPRDRRPFGCCAPAGRVARGARSTRRRGP